MKRQYTMKLVEVIPNITEEKTLPAASSDAAGIVEEAAAKTTPPVVTESSFPKYKLAPLLREAALDASALGGIIESQAPHKPRAIQKIMKTPCLASPYYKGLVENGDGEISLAELPRCLDAEAAGAFIDTDWDGMFAFDDFGKLLHGRNEENKVNGFKGAFQLYEMDDLVSQDPKLRAIQKNGEKPRLRKVSPFEHLFKAFDENGDGKISPADELRQCLDAEEAGAFIDTDGDGLLAFDYFVKLVHGRNEENKVNHFKGAFELYEMDDLVSQAPKASWGTDRLPVSRRDLKNITLQQKYLNCTAIGRMLDISPQHHGILLMLFGSILSYLAKTSTTPFEFQVGKTKSTPESLLSFHEAFYGFIPEIAHITVFMICYILTWRLVLPLQPGVQIFLVLLLISAPLFYFPDLIRKASTLGVDVSCGSSFKLPLIGFTCIAAFGITLTFGLLTLLVVYLNKRFIHGRKPTRGQDIEVNSNDLINV